MLSRPAKLHNKHPRKRIPRINSHSTDPFYVVCKHSFCSLTTGCRPGVMNYHFADLRSYVWRLSLRHWWSAIVDHCELFTSYDLEHGNFMSRGVGFNPAGESFTLHILMEWRKFTLIGERIYCAHLHVAVCMSLAGVTYSDTFPCIQILASFYEWRTNWERNKRI